MPGPTILMVANTGSKPAQYQRALEKAYPVSVVRSGKQAVITGRKLHPALVVLDAVSMRTTGERICQTICDAMPDVPVVHIHPGPRSAAVSVAAVVLFPPLSARRLFNCVELLLGSEQDEVIECGPFLLNIPNRTLIAHGKEQQLTPKVAALLEVFMRHPGETLDRKSLMERVWNTDYLGDTRTLDVHIRWVRDVLENGSKQPRFLKTVRGVGYRLVISDASD